ncbi:monocarboxylate transporter 13-like [Contarinia nasturtii]|uniref:monocarboxylate transporter 13-like n=1 Tax=Contarinia nasturtii TaxID=265458 RepID=UPI0012D48C74|nr:monocarboxylate transporter 13-like [Contarinia nasturtii]
MANGTRTRQRVNNNTNKNSNEENLLENPNIDGGWGWVVVFASFCIHIITDGITYSFGVLYIQLLDEFKEGKGYTSSILSIMAGITLCSGPISSSLTVKYGCRTVIIAGSVLASTCLLISVYAENVITLILSTGVGVGFGFGMIYLPAIVGVSVYFKKYRSLATGIAVAGSGFGTFIFAPLVAFIAEAYGWRKSLSILSLIVLGCALFGVLFRPPTKLTPKHQHNQITTTEHSDAFQRDDTRNEYRRQNNNGNSDIIFEYESSENESKPLIDNNRKLTTSTLQHRSLQNILNNSLSEISSTESDSSRQIEDCRNETHKLDVLKNPIFLLFAASNVATDLGFYIPYFYLPDRSKELGISEKDAGGILATIGIFNTIGRVVLGWISDRSYQHRIFVYKVCLFTCGVATASSVFCLDLESLTIYAAVFGFTIGAYVGLTSVILVDLMGLQKLTDAFGMLLLFQGISSLIGPPIVGALHDEFKTYTPGFIFAGAMIILSSILTSFIPILQKYIARKELRREYASIE